MTDSLLCVVAHPDDETRLCGGLLAMLAHKGVAVHILALTRGEGGELGEPPLATRETIGAVREAELVCAAGKLGARSLTFLDYVDPTVGPDNALFAPKADPVVLSGQIANTVRQCAARVVLTHGTNGEYGHPAHKLVNQATLAAVMSFGDEAPLLYTFAASFAENTRPRLANADDPAHFVIDTRPYVEQVLAAALCHKTQHALFVRRRSQEAGRPLTVREVIAAETHESVRRQWPPSESVPRDLFAEWLGRS